jgi:hypothetical protein
MRSPSSSPSIWHGLEALDDKGFTVRGCRYYRVRAFPRYLLISTVRIPPADLPKFKIRFRSSGLVRCFRENSWCGIACGNRLLLPEVAFR